MSRIPLLTGEGLTLEQERIYARIVSGPRGKMIGPFRAALHSPELAETWQALGEVLRYRNSLPKYLSELAVLVVGRFWASEVEWFVHSAQAREAGLPDPAIEAIRTFQLPVFEEERAQAVYDFACELLHGGEVSDASYDLARKWFGDVGVVELAALVGYYSMVSMTLNAHQIPLPPGEQVNLPEASADNGPGYRRRIGMLPQRDAALL